MCWDSGHCYFRPTPWKDPTERWSLLGEVTSAQCTSPPTKSTSEPAGTGLPRPITFPLFVHPSRNRPAQTKVQVLVTIQEDPPKGTYFGMHHFKSLTGQVLDFHKLSVIQVSYLSTRTKDVAGSPSCFPCMITHLPLSKRKTHFLPIPNLPMVHWLGGKGMM